MQPKKVQQVVRLFIFDCSSARAWNLSGYGIDFRSGAFGRRDLFV